MYNKNKQYGKTESISSPSHSEENEIHCLLEEASNVARGVLESIQAIAGTTVVKGVQIANLERFARDRGYWIEDINTIGIFSDRGSENEVYLSIENNTNIFIFTDGLPSFSDKEIELRPRTLETIRRALGRVGMFL